MRIPSTTAILAHNAITLSAQYLPPSLRHFFLANRQQRYGSVEGTLKLAQVNYNWTRVLPIE
jgi:hypothetical protein